jgi:hypothetical protein
MQIQLLRSHFDIKCEHGRRTCFADTKVFAPCNAPCVRTIFQQNGKQKNLAFSACRACWLPLKHTLTAFNQISSYALQCGKDRGVPRGNILADFLWYFLCSATKKVHQKPAQRGAKLYARPEEKALKS